jgi:hypothetical protein
MYERRYFASHQMNLADLEHLSWVFAKTHIKLCCICQTSVLPQHTTCNSRIHFSSTANITHTQQYRHTTTTFSMDAARSSLPHRRSTRNTTRSIWSPMTPTPHFPQRQLTPPKSKELSEQNSRQHTAHAWSARRKWTLLNVDAFCQVSMNFNAAVYSNAVTPLNKHFGIDKARLGMTAFLIPYAVGCELWAPWSEEVGWWPVMQISLGLTNVSVIICALATSFQGIIGGRVMGGSVLPVGA